MKEFADCGERDDGERDRRQLLARLGVPFSSRGVVSQQAHGHVGGMVAGRLGSNKYVVRLTCTSSETFLSYAGRLRSRREK